MRIEDLRRQRLIESIESRFSSLSEAQVRELLKKEK
jgi:hypothetical protein